MSKFKCVLYSIIHAPLPSLLLWYWNECDNGLFQITRIHPYRGRSISIKGSDLRQFNEVFKAFLWILMKYCRY